MPRSTPDCVATDDGAGNRLLRINSGTRLSPWPLPPNWTTFVNKPQTKAEVEALRLSVNRGRPFGTDDWQKKTAEQLELEYTMRSRGRPRKEDDK